VNRIWISLLTFFCAASVAAGQNAPNVLSLTLPEAERLARLQALSEGHGKRLNLTALEADLQRLPVGRRGEEQAAWIAQRLYQWRVEMTNVDRKSA